MRLTPRTVASSHHVVPESPAVKAEQKRSIRLDRQLGRNSRDSVHRINPVVDLLSSDRRKWKIEYRPDGKDWEQALRKRPLIRTRTSGLVGPEPDWSVIYSDLPMKFIYAMNPGSGRGNERYFHGQMKFRPIIRRDAGIFGVDLHPFGMAETYLFSKEDILHWTSIAHQLGVCFKGERGYTLPSNLKKVVLQQSLYSSSQVDYFCERKTHSRSSFARIRRAARRANTVKDSVPSQIPLVKSNVVLSKREISRAWYSSGRPLKFKKFRELFVFDEFKWYLTYPKRTHVSEPVARSLQKIYSVEVETPLRPISKSVSIPINTGISPPMVKSTISEQYSVSNDRVFFDIPKFINGKSVNVRYRRNYNDGQTYINIVGGMVIKAPLDWKFNPPDWLVRVATDRVLR